MTKGGFIQIVIIVAAVVLGLVTFAVNKRVSKVPEPVFSPQREVTSNLNVKVVSPTPSLPPKSVTPSPVLALPTSQACPGYNDANSLREFIFCAFGFREEAASRIRNTTSIVVKDLNSTSGGGLWYAVSRKVELLTAQREAAVHELSHAFWEDERGDSQRRLSLVKDLIKLATLDKNTNSQYVNAINFAYEYVWGTGDWKGMFCAYDQKTCVNKDPRNLTDQEVIDFTRSYIILDHEIYAGFSSWTMGKINSGSHQLPSFMATHFTEEFSGSTKAVPYYEGGPQ
ncbi:hypothetical protein A2696_00265 [Candidatus Curtissbacteria bacterium RIFCSPHIGHO2_01_FULL_41_13]|uniref:Uncharacterized protein n=1 Tax=Candidatus Curtissbacteria bacterium RIFCSPHIGHO2_01_FULL_41_13 TaxID=1797745 RepID=A0A1F5FZZ1_9BACT|nr:MAG: hypothetical protein A2696_00265 [Candidatus Curtissbacteria bacterium RIFCSPHIGHO2_01_FULL_41_13]